MALDLIDGDDVQVRRLLDLLGMLPGREDDFWDDFADAESTDPGARSYITGKLATGLALLDDDKGWERRWVTDLARYCLLFFEGKPPAVLCVLDRVVEHFGIDRPGAIGRRWAEDVSATAWDLLVRHEDIERRRRRLTAWAASTHA